MRDIAEEDGDLVSLKRDNDVTNFRIASSDPKGAVRLKRGRDADSTQFAQGEVTECRGHGAT
jgi:hypothetical protein